MQSWRGRQFVMPSIVLIKIDPQMDLSQICSQRNLTTQSDNKDILSINIQHNKMNKTKSFVLVYRIYEIKFDELRDSKRMINSHNQKIYN
jgi:hypothetical protein